MTALAALGLTPEQAAERAAWVLDLYDLRARVRGDGSGEVSALGSARIASGRAKPGDPGHQEVGDS